MKKPLDIKVRHDRIMDRAERSKEGMPNEYQAGWLDALNWVLEKLDEEAIDYEAGGINKPLCPNV